MRAQSMHVFQAHCQALERALQQGPWHDEVMEHHAQMLGAMLVSLRQANRELLLSLVSGLSLPQQLRTRLTDKVHALRVSPLKFQDWTNMVYYLTDAFVAKLAQGPSAPEAKANMLMEWFWKMGLREPSEATFQTLTALILISAGMLEISAAQKKDVLDKCKKTWRLRIGQDPTLWVECLPASWRSMEFLVPAEWWQGCFGAAAENVKWASFDVNQFHSIVQSVPMRNTRSDVRPLVAPSVQAPLQQQVHPQLQPQLPNPQLQLLTSCMQMLLGRNPAGAPGQALRSFAGSLTAGPSDPFAGLNASSPSPIIDAGPEPRDAVAGERPAREPAAGDGEDLSSGARPGEEHPTEVPSAGTAPGASIDTAADVGAAGHLTLGAVTEMLQTGVKKKPASNKGSSKGKSKGKSASCSKGKSKGKVAPSPAKGKGKSKSKTNPVPARIMRDRPYGCAKCRGKPGCSESCRSIYNTRPYLSPP
jgi:hypothetical protein